MVSINKAQKLSKSLIILLEMVYNKNKIYA